MPPHLTPLERLHQLLHLVPSLLSRSLLFSSVIRSKFQCKLRTMLASGCLRSSTCDWASFCIPGGLMYGSCKQPCHEHKTYVGLSSSTYYTLWLKLCKMNNNF